MAELNYSHFGEASFSHQTRAHKLLTKGLLVHCSHHVPLSSWANCICTHWDHKYATKLIILWNCILGIERPKLKWKFCGPNTIPESLTQMPFWLMSTIRIDRTVCRLGALKQQSHRVDLMRARVHSMVDTVIDRKCSTVNSRDDSVQSLPFQSTIFLYC